MAFLEPQVEQDNWIGVETIDGTYYLPAYTVGIPSAWNLSRVQAGDGVIFENVAEFYRMYTQQAIVEVEYLQGKWGARFSAPGYLDCTEWCVFDTEEEAEEYLREEEEQ